MTIPRCHSNHPDFCLLAAELEEELKIRDGNQHELYSGINKVDFLEYSLVAYINEVPVGCGAIRNYNTDAMEIKRMYVRPTCRKQGIAKSILRELEKWTKELGCFICMLETGRNQPEAFALYCKCLYHEIPKFGPYTDSENSICFAKIL